MPDIFISYSHKDSEYAHRLADELRKHAIDVWIDERIDYGEQWPRVIQENLTLSKLFLLIMSGNSFNSAWVQNEMSFAQANNKPIYPLLLEGPVWLSMAATQYVDVRGGKMPPERFFEELHSDLNLSVPPTPAPVPARREPAHRKQAAPRNWRSLYIGGAIFLCAAILCGLTPVAWRWISSMATPDAPKQIKATPSPQQSAVTPEPVSRYAEPTPTPAQQMDASSATRTVAELYGLPESSVEKVGLWFEVGMCYNMDRLYLTDDASCDLIMDLDGLLYPVNGAKAVGYIPNRSIDLEVCRALLDEKQDQAAPVNVPHTTVVCFQTNEGRYGFLFGIDIDPQTGTLFDAYTLP